MLRSDLRSLCVLVVLVPALAFASVPRPRILQAALTPAPVCGAEEVFFDGACRDSGWLGDRLGGGVFGGTRGAQGDASVLRVNGDEQSSSLTWIAPVQAGEGEQSKEEPTGEHQFVLRPVFSPDDEQPRFEPIERGRVASNASLGGYLVTRDLAIERMDGRMFAVERALVDPDATNPYYRLEVVQEFEFDAVSEFPVCNPGMPCVVAQASVENGCQQENAAYAKSIATLLVACLTENPLLIAIAYADYYSAYFDLIECLGLGQTP